MLDIWSGSVIIEYRTMKHRGKKLSDELRAAIKNSGMSRYRICKETGIDEGLMSRFMTGKSMLSLRAADRVGALLDLHFKVGSKGKGGRRSK